MCIIAYFEASQTPANSTLLITFINIFIFYASCGVYLMRILSIGNEYSKEIVPGRISTAKGAVHITKTAKTTNNTNSIVLVYCINDIYNNSLFCQRLLIGRKNDRI